MLSFEVLCATMGQKDFSKVKEMNIRSDVVFANQADTTSYQEEIFENGCAKMITTATRGVGINRNLALAYASADICLFSDDDVVYNDNYKDTIIKEFENHPNADVFIFHFETDSIRKQKKYKKTRKCSRFSRQPWGTCRVAVKLSSVKKANIHFSTLFGGGCIFPSGEDSKWLKDAKKAGLKFYVSKETIGKVSFEKSTWFTGYNEKFYFAKGAFYQALHPKMFLIWQAYFILRTFKFGKMKISEKIHWMNIGKIGYKEMKPYEKFI